MPRISRLVISISNGKGGLAPDRRNPSVHGHDVWPACHSPTAKRDLRFHYRDLSRHPQLSAITAIKLVSRNLGLTSKFWNCANLSLFPYAVIRL